MERLPIRLYTLNMNIIIEKHRCTGCAACLNACAHSAISFTRDEEGFDYPHIDQTKCIDCRLCQKVCPVLHYDERQEKRNDNSCIQKAFAAKTQNEKDRSVSSSGGVFPALARHILSNGGVVVGAAFDGKFNVYHKCISTTDELNDIQASKYAQSTIGLLYKEIKGYLRTGTTVFFCGLACQVEGLKSYLGREYDHLYTADLICMGIPSPGVWRNYLDTFFKGETIKHINFKDKTYGWHSFSMRIETDKRVFLQHGFDNPFFQCMFRTYSLRPSCFNCPYKKSVRMSDFTLADCWGTVAEVPELDDNKGLSSVVVHSQKGMALWREILDFDSREVALFSIETHNDNLVRNKVANAGREEFYRLYKVSPYRAIRKFGKSNRTFKQRLKEKMKRTIRIIKGR